MTKVRSIYLDHEYICKYSTNTIIWIYDIPGSVDNFNGLIMNIYFKRRSPFGKPGVIGLRWVSHCNREQNTYTCALCDHFVPAL